ncbi:MAG TPA: protein-methionine-sulfoxide reductase heme-binding subunit MsrQ [Stellaceae bacterium]|nr:protein-methionine-sulfoxide reductase heme-binding subunit MsrQ [Stellaceae bacterium]
MQPLKRPWRDYSGRISPLKTATFAALFLPALWVAYRFATHRLGARPMDEALLEIGQWTLRILFLALAVSPLSRMLAWPRLNLIRRMLGVGAFTYIAIHFSLYIVSEAYSLGTVASEILKRVYLSIGLVALLGLVALAATSTDGMVRRMGPRRWQALHRFVYLIGVFGLVHFFLQSKLDEWEPTVMIGLFAWLMGWRALAWRFGRRPVPLWSVALLSLAVGPFIALLEAVYFHFAYHVTVARVLTADLSFETGIRPAWVVFGIVVAATGVALVRAALRRPSLKPA